MQEVLLWVRRPAVCWMALTCPVGDTFLLLIGDGGEGGRLSAEAQFPRSEPAAPAAEAMFCCNGMQHFGSQGPLAGEQARAEWAEYTQGQGWWLRAQAPHL